MIGKLFGRFFGKKEKPENSEENIIEKDISQAVSTKSYISNMSFEKKEEIVPASEIHPYKKRVIEDSGFDIVEKWVGWNFCGWIRVAGVTAYRDNAERTANSSPENKVLTLIREPENEYDQNAVMVLDAGKLIGYIDRQTSSELRKRFSTDMPIRALFKRGYVGESGAIAIDILPQMPSAKERKALAWER